MWGTDANAATYALRRGVTENVWPPLPLRTGLLMTSSLEPDVPGPPDLYLYRSAGERCSGIEGD